MASNVDLSGADAIDRRLARIHEIAERSGHAILPFFRAQVAVDNKDADVGGYDPVTEADKAGERALRSAIAAAFPDDAIAGEEYEDQGGTSGITWVLDPIDGTRAFISGFPTWGTLIAVRDAEAVRIGALDQPYLRERFVGHRDGSTLNGRPIRCRACPSLAHATLSTTGIQYFEADERESFLAVESRVRLSRHGFDCYAYAMLALGMIDIVVEAGLKPHDIQALIPIVQGAGGIVTDWQGGPADRGGRIVACGDARVHAQALGLLQGTGVSSSDR